MPPKPVIPFTFMGRVMRVGKLTDKQEKFVQELIKGKSQRQAYRTAYPKSKQWLDNTVDAAASKLFKNDKVFTRYNEIHDRLIKEAEDECIVSAKEVLGELKRIAFADIKDFLTFKTAESLIEYNREGDPVIDYRQIIQVKDSDEVDGRLIQEVSINSKGVFTFKLHDKMAALDKLGKHLKLFTDKVEVLDDRANPFKELTTEELKKLIQDG